MNHKEQIAKQLQETIDELYSEFSKYARPPEGIVTCFDFGPTEEEAIAFAKPLKEIPREYINHLEFFDERGTVAEVKYLIPRILECYWQDIEAQDYLKMDYPIGLHFIRYQLVDLKEGSKWNKKEAECTRRYLLLFHEYLSLLPDEEAIQAYLDFMDALCDVVEDVAPYITIWEKVPDTIKSKQIEAWLKAHINPDTLELSPHNWSLDESPPLRAATNQNKIKSWVLSEENITNNMELFAQDPWWKLALQ